MDTAEAVEMLHTMAQIMQGPGDKVLSMLQYTMLQKTRINLHGLQIIMRSADNDSDLASSWKCTVVRVHVHSTLAKRRCGDLPI